MTDPELVAKKLALVETCLRELREVVLNHLGDPEEFIAAIRRRS
jgi:hypothetical protein